MRVVQQILLASSLIALITASTFTRPLAAEDPATPLPFPPSVGEGQGGGAGKVDPAVVEFFEKDVRPILVARCFKCHSGDEPKGGLRLDSRETILAGGDSGPVVELGAPDESLLLEAIRYQPDGLIQMPPTGKLPDPEIAALVKWVRMGVPWPLAHASGFDDSTVTRSVSEGGERGRLRLSAEKDANQTGSHATQTSHWAFAPPRDPPLPDVSNAGWPKSPLDTFILAKLEEAGLTPAPPADKRTLIRRATYTLTGLPPTPEEIEAFLNDDSPDAFAKVVDRLLASPHYGERWGRHWLDVARYADSNGVDENLAYANAFRYRDYVVAAFNKDKPYDQFVREQIAGDLLPGAGDSSRDPAAPIGQADEEARRDEPLVATGFLAIGPKMLACDDPVKMQMDIIDEQIDTIGRTFMGLTLGCARCHDHKFDPITTEDYYALAGIFKSTKTMENFKVVARWYERPLASQKEIQKEQELAGRIEKTKAEIDGRTKSANDRLVREARRHASRYLLAGTELLEQTSRHESDHPASPARSEQASTESETSPEASSRVTSSKTPQQLADEYDLNPAFLNQWAEYLKKTVDDPKSILSAWHRFNRELREPGASQVADNSANAHPGISQMFAEFASESRRRLAERYQELFDQSDHAWLQLQLDNPSAKALADPTQEALRQVLYDPKGPFALPDDAERYYPESDLSSLKQLRETLASLENEMPEIPYAMGVAEGEPKDIPVHIRGSHLNLGEIVPRRFPAVFASGRTAKIDSTQSGRLQLADWIASPDHSLTSRVMANRIWRWHFGSGLVPTPDNFGTMGEPPVNQPLLDWLALRFVESGWSIKTMHRLILLSATYQMSSAYNERAAAVDPEDKLLWRMPPQRLEAEEIRDAILAVSGTLDPIMGGSILTTKNREYVTSTGNKNYKGYDSTKRSLYLPVVRSALYDMFEVFDFAEPSMLSGDRATTTVAPQSLFMMNSEMVADAARHMADGLLAQDGLDDAGRVQQAYQRAYGRPATNHEVDRALEFVSRFQRSLKDTQSGAGSASDRSPPRALAWQGLCQAIFASSEFIYVN